jgi:hypothetical protein
MQRWGNGFHATGRGDGPRPSHGFRPGQTVRSRPSHDLPAPSRWMQASTIHYVGDRGCHHCPARRDRSIVSSPPRRPPATPDLCKAAIALYANGRSLREISAVLPMSSATAGRILKWHGIPARRQYVDRIDIGRVSAMRTAGLSVKAIAEIMGRDPCHMGHVVARMESQ